MISLAITPSPTPAPHPSTVDSWLSAVNPINVGISVVAALVSALFAAYITHRLTSKRAWNEWRRQRVFEGIVKLNDALELLVDEKHKVPLRDAWGSNQSRSVFEVLLIADSVDYSALRELLHRYWNAVREVKLLVGKETGLRTECLESQMAAMTYYKRFTAPFPRDSEYENITLGDVFEGITEAHDALRETHRALVDGLARTYLNATIKEP